MTSPYQWSVLPYKIDIRCPTCEGHAKFEFSVAVTIKKKKDIPYFKASRVFEYEYIERKHITRYPTNSWHAAVFYPGLQQTHLETITDLPEGYSPQNWEQPQWGGRQWSDKGTSICQSCNRRKKHVLNWPKDAFFQTEVRGKALWAYDRKSLIALRNYVTATERDKTRHISHFCFLLHVPTYFLTSKVRSETIKKLDRLLAN